MYIIFNFKRIYSKAYSQTECKSLCKQNKWSPVSSFQIWNSIKTHKNKVEWNNHIFICFVFSFQSNSLLKKCLPNI